MSSTFTKTSNPRTCTEQRLPSGRRARQDEYFEYVRGDAPRGLVQKKVKEEFARGPAVACPTMRCRSSTCWPTSKGPDVARRPIVRKEARAWVNTRGFGPRMPDETMYGPLLDDFCAGLAPESRSASVYLFRWPHRRLVCDYCSGTFDVPLLRGLC